MNATAIIQARMGSTRLPGKVLLPLFDKTVLGQVICRLQASEMLQAVMVATTVCAEDDKIVADARQYGVGVYRGSEEDVLRRFYEASLQTDSDWIVRITADCPLMDGKLVDAMLRDVSQRLDPLDYLSNTLLRTFPRGLDVEIIAKRALHAAHACAELRVEREHVTPFIYRHPERYRLAIYAQEVDHSHHRWTLDTKEDWLLIQAIYQHLYGKNPLFSWQDALQFVEQHPEIASLNREVRQKEIDLADIGGAAHAEPS